MKTFLAFLAALSLSQCYGDNDSATIIESVVAQPEADVLFPDLFAEIGDKLQRRKLSHDQRRRRAKSSKKSADPTPTPSVDPCTGTTTSTKSSKRSQSSSSCVPVAPPVPQPVSIAPLAPVTQPVAAPVTVPFYVPVTQPNSPPVGAPVAVTISFSSSSSAKSPVTVPAPSPVATPGSSAPVSSPSGGTTAPVVTTAGTSSAPVVVTTAGTSSAPVVVTTAGTSSAPVVVTTAGTTNAPVVTSGGTTAPVVGIYVEATAEDCQAITSGTGLVQGQNGMNSETFTFSFTINTITATNLASVVATAKAALRALVAQNVVKCGSSTKGKGKGGKRWRNRRNLQHKVRGRGLQGHRQNKQRRRYLLEDNIVGNADFNLNCAEITTNCPVPGTCFICDSTMEVFMKGAAPQTDVENEFQGMIESPTFLQDSGLDAFATDFVPTQLTFLASTSAGGETGNETGGETGNETGGETGNETGGETGNETGGDTGGDGFGDVPDNDTENETGNEPNSNAGSRGDPHFKSWQGEHFEFHGQCDLVLARDPKFAGLGLDVQIRTKLVRYWSYIKSAAVRIGDVIVEVEGSVDIDNQIPNYWVNFELQGKQSTIGGFPLAYFDDHARPHPKRRFEIDLGSKYPGHKIVIATFKEFVKVDFKNASMKAYGNTVGILGDYKNGLTYARDRTTVIQDFNDLGLEWQVRPDDDMMMFHDVEEPQFPQKCLLPEDPRGQRRRRLGSSSVSTEEAQVACASLKDPMDIKDCVYDILATQDLDMVGAF